MEAVSPVSPGGFISNSATWEALTLVLEMTEVSPKCRLVGALLSAGLGARKETHLLGTHPSLHS